MDDASVLDTLDDATPDTSSLQPPSSFISMQDQNPLTLQVTYLRWFLGLVLYTSVATLSSPDDSMQGVTGDSEQPDYPVRPVTPGEEELMRIHEDGGYCAPDMIEIPGGFQIGRYRIRPETPERLSSMVCRSSC